MIQAIVYESNTGFTAEYAKMLGEALSLPAYARAEAFDKLAQGAEIAFLGWLKAGSIQGLSSIKRRYVIRALAAVGLAPAEESSAGGMNRRYAAFAPVFYLPGGFDMSKLRGGNRAVMKAIAAVVGRVAKGKGAASKGAVQMHAMLQNGGTHVDKTYLEPMVQYIRER